VKIQPNEVESVKEAGTLNDQSVKIIKTIGGWFCAVGSKSKGKKAELEPLAAGSHQALVMHQLSKEYGKDFKPALMKGEHEAMPTVKEFTGKLPHEMVDAGYCIYSLTKNDEINFIATKLGAEIVNIQGSLTSNGIENLKKISINKDSFENTEAIARTLKDIINENLE
jgi:hypothetical protein